MAAVPPSIALCADTQENLDKEFFLSLGAKVVSFPTPDALLEYLKATRPHGVCLVFGVQTLLSRPPWLHALERRAFFEGLRVVVFVRSFGGGISVNELLSSSSDESLRARFAPVLAFRDTIIYDFPLTSRERKMLHARVALSLGLTAGPVHDEKTPLLVRRAGRVRVSLPGRASWIGNDKSICIECSVRPKLSSFCTLRFVEGRRSVLELHAICKESSTTNLRFNYGSKIRVGLNDAEFMKLVDYFKREDQRNLAKGRAIRRAVVVVRNAELRERVTQLLRSRHVECRYPLVWKSVKSDVSRMNPHFVIVEDAILLRTPEKSDSLMAELKSVIQGGAELCLVGPSSEELAARHSGLQSFPDLPRLEQMLGAYLDRNREAQSPGEEGRLWIAADSSVADCIVEVEDEHVFIGSNGIVVEGPHSYRSLCNAVIDFQNGEPRLLAKNTGSYLSTDLWKLPPAATAGDLGNLALFHFTFLQVSEDYAREFNFALRLESESFRQRHPMQAEQEVASPRAPEGEGELVLPDTEEEALAPLRPKGRRKRRQRPQWEAWIIVAVVAAVLAGLAYVATQQPSEEARFTRSFQQLFESRGKLRESPP